MTWTTLVLRLVQTDLYCMVLWRDWARERHFLFRPKSVCHPYQKPRAKRRSVRGSVYNAMGVQQKMFQEV